MTILRSTIVTMALVLFGMPSHADESDVPDVRIVIDISGSMKETDPQNLRRPALDLLAELLPEGSRAGVWTFGRYVNMLVPLGMVDDQWRENARKSSSKINSVGLNTNLVDALDRALYEMSQDSGFDQTVIVLTDGHIDMDDTQGNAFSPVNSAARSRLLKVVLPKYIDGNVRIHTLALSDDADTAMLNQLAMETDGLALRARNSEELMPTFLKAFDRAVPSEQVPLVGNSFVIDSNVNEFTALIFRAATDKETVLIAPSGQRISEAYAESSSDVRWHHDLNFDLITVRMPEDGGWAVDADIAPDSRVQILSDLKLRVTGLPASVFSGVPVQLEMALENEGDVVTEPTILQLTDVSLKVTAPDGRIGSKLLSDPEALPMDGVFHETLGRLSQPGEYQVEVNAQGRTFQRRRILTATLAEPMRVEVNPDFEQQVFNVLIYPQSDLVDTSLSRVIARIASPDGSSVIHTMGFSNDSGAWELALIADKGLGDYEIMLNVRGVSGSGKTFKSKPESIQVTFPLTAPQETPPESLPAANDSLSQPPVSEPETTSDAALEPAPEPEVLEPPVESIAPDLAARFDEQATAPPPETREVNTQDKQEPESEIDDEEGNVAWWVYVLLGLANLIVLGGVGWWLIRRKLSTGSPEINTAAVDSEAAMNQVEDAELNSTASGNANDVEEEEIPQAKEDSHIPTSMGGDTDMGSPDSSADSGAPDDGGDDWGEFDLPDENPADKK